MKRGDVFYEVIEFNNRNGRSSTEPFLIGSYGNSGLSPVFKTGSLGGIRFIKYRKFLVLSGIDFYSQSRDPEGEEFVNVDGATGLSFLGGPVSETIDNKMEGILLEGCKFRSFIVNSIQGYENSDGIVIRRCSFLDSYSENQGHSQGLLFGGINGSATIEECIFDHNGWYSKAGSGEIGPATIFNHNLYAGGINHFLL